jgi:recombination protein RecA
MIDDQKQIIIGSLLGNGFICNSKNSYLCIQHSVDYIQYFKSKIAHIEEYGRLKAWYEKGKTCGWRSRCSPIWSDFKKMCYKKGVKTVTMDWLDQLRAIGIAVWYGDSGCLIGYKKSNACLRTQSFGKVGNEIICRYFNEIGIECNINKSKKSYVIVFTKKGTNVFLKMVAPYIHYSMYDKLLKV